MVIFLANLQSISPDLYEAAEIDGANGLKKFMYVTLPLMCPSVKIVIVTGLIGGMKVFDIIYSMTSGGPGDATQTLPILMYQKAFKNYELGYGTAISMILLLVSAIFGLIYTKMNGKEA